LAAPAGGEDQGAGERGEAQGHGILRNRGQGGMFGAATGSVNVDLPRARGGVSSRAFSPGPGPGVPPMNTTVLRAALAATLATTALRALAQSAGAEGAWSFGGEVIAASDYVWRGVSQTMEDPALQLEAYVEHESGFYAGAFASNVDFGDPDDGIDYELETYVGWAGALGETTELDIFVSRVAYPGHNGADYDIDYTEAQAVLTFV